MDRTVYVEKIEKTGETKYNTNFQTLYQPASPLGLVFETRFSEVIDKKGTESMDSNPVLRTDSRYRCHYSEDSILYSNPDSLIRIPFWEPIPVIDATIIKILFFIRIPGNWIHWFISCDAAQSVSQSVGTRQQRGNMERKKCSKAWLHFTRKDDETAICNHCQALLSVKGGSPTNMLKHVQAVHNLKVREACRVFDTWRSSERDDSLHAPL